MPVQNCSLLKGIRIRSDELVGGGFFIGSRFAPSICRSVAEENGRDIIWGKSEQEIELIIRLHVRKLLGRNINILNVKIFWEWDELPEEEVEEPPFRRTDYKAIFLNAAEREIFNTVDRQSGKYYDSFCSLDSAKEGGSYLVCRKIPNKDWDRLMTTIAIRSLPFIN